MPTVKQYKTETKKQVLARTRRNWDPFARWGEGPAAVENSMMVPQTIKNRITT